MFLLFHNHNKIKDQHLWITTTCHRLKTNQLKLRNKHQTKSQQKVELLQNRLSQSKKQRLLLWITKASPVEIFTSSKLEMRSQSLNQTNTNACQTTKTPSSPTKGMDWSQGMVQIQIRALWETTMKIELPLFWISWSQSPRISTLTSGQNARFSAFTMVMVGLFAPIFWGTTYISS